VSTATPEEPEIVRAWADSCSDTELEWLLASNLLVRHFVGLSLLAASVLAGTLWERYGAGATFLAGAAFAALSALGLLNYRPKSA